MAKSLQAAGVTIVPVPVFYPDVQMILGEKVYRKLQDIPEPVDIVDVFRRAEDLAGHLDDILHVKPKVQCWFPIGHLSVMQITPSEWWLTGYVLASWWQRTALSMSFKCRRLSGFSLASVKDISRTNLQRRASPWYQTDASWSTTNMPQQNYRCHKR